MKLISAMKCAALRKVEGGSGFLFMLAGEHGRSSRYDHRLCLLSVMKAAKPVRTLWWAPTGSQLCTVQIGGVLLHAGGDQMVGMMQSCRRSQPCLVMSSHGQA